MLSALRFSELGLSKPGNASEILQGAPGGTVLGFVRPIAELDESFQLWLSMSLQKVALNVFVRRPPEGFLEELGGEVRQLGESVDIQVVPAKLNAFGPGDADRLLRIAEEGDDRDFLGNPLSSSKWSGVAVGVSGGLPDALEALQAVGWRLVVQIESDAPPFVPGVFGVLAREPLDVRENWAWFWDF